MLRASFTYGKRVLSSGLVSTSIFKKNTQQEVLVRSLIRLPSIRLLCTEKHTKNEHHKDINKPNLASNQADHGKAGGKQPEHPPQSKPPTSTHHHTLTENIASTVHHTQQLYGEYEKYFMERIHYRNQQRFRLTLISALITIIWIAVVFGKPIRKFFADWTAGFAKETLENESVKVQTQELATAVVQTILENQDIVSHAAAFLRDASNTPETQQALQTLTLKILQHEQTLKELTKLSQKLIKNLADDKETVAELGRMLERVLMEPELRATLVVLVGQLCQDKEVFAAVSDLVVRLAAEDKVTQSTSELLTGSISDIMQDTDVSYQSRQFIADVVGDDLLQREGGLALWKSIQYALQPGFFRITGATLVMVSLAFGKLMLSPY